MHNMFSCHSSRIVQTRMWVPVRILNPTAEEEFISFWLKFKIKCQIKLHFICAVGFLVCVLSEAPFSLRIVRIVYEWYCLLLEPYLWLFMAKLYCSYLWLQILATNFRCWLLLFSLTFAVIFLWQCAFNFFLQWICAKMDP